MSNRSQAWLTPSTPRVVGPQQIAAELEIVGRIGEHEVDGAGRHSAKRLDAIALNNAPLAIGGKASSNA